MCITMANYRSHSFVSFYNLQLHHQSSSRYAKYIYSFVYSEYEFLLESYTLNENIRPHYVYNLLFVAFNVHWVVTDPCKSSQEIGKFFRSFFRSFIHFGVNCFCMYSTHQTHVDVLLNMFRLSCCKISV